MMTASDITEEMILSHPRYKSIRCLYQDVVMFTLAPDERKMIVDEILLELNRSTPVKAAPPVKVAPPVKAAPPVKVAPPVDIGGDFFSSAAKDDAFGGDFFSAEEVSTSEEETSTDEASTG